MGGEGEGVTIGAAHKNQGEFALKIVFVHFFQKIYNKVGIILTTAEEAHVAPQ